MRLLPAYEQSQEEQEAERLLLAHPVVLYRLARLLGTYHEMVQAYLEAHSEEERPDPADMCKRLWKQEMATLRLGIPIPETPADWYELSEQWRAAQRAEDQEKEERLPHPAKQATPAPSSDTTAPPSPLAGE